MKKTIQAFRETGRGLFIDLTDVSVSVGIDRTNGNVLLFEGDGNDRYHGAMISSDECRDLALEKDAADGWNVVLHFGEDNSHSFGNTTDESAALDWIDKAWAVIRAKQSPDLINAALMVKEEGAAYASA